MARESVPLVPRNVGLRAEETWLTCSSWEHLVELLAQLMISITLVFQYVMKDEPDLDREAMMHSEWRGRKEGGEGGGSMP